MLIHSNHLQSKLAIPNLDVFSEDDSQVSVISPPKITLSRRRCSLDQEDTLYAEGPHCPISATCTDLLLFLSARPDSLLQPLSSRASNHENRAEREREERGIDGNRVSRRRNSNEQIHESQNDESTAKNSVCARCA